MPFLLVVLALAVAAVLVVSGVFLVVLEDELST
jgi:hypothetical protein